MMEPSSPKNWFADTWGKFERKAFCSKSRSEMIATSANSGAALKKSLTALDLVFLGVGSIVGAGVFVVTGVAARESSGPAVVVAYLLAGFSAIVSAFCYAEFAVEVPVAGGAYTYVRMTFGELTAWIAATNFLMEYTLSAAAVARAMSSYTATLFGAEPGVMRIGMGSVKEFDLDIFAAAIVVVLCAMLSYGTKAGARFNNVVTLISLVVIAFVVCAGLPHFDNGNMKPFTPFGTRGIFSGAAQVYFSFIGFDTVSTASEETINPRIALPLGIVGSLVICSAIYSLMCVTICGMVPFDQIDVDAPFAVAFSDVGMDWAQYVVSLGAVAAIVTSLFVALLGNSRLIMALGRERLISPWLANVNERTQTPVNATVLTAITVGLFALLVDLDVLADMVSIGTLFVFLTVSLACLWKRYHPQGGRVRPVLLAKVLALVAASIVLSFNYSKRGPDWLSYAGLGLLALTAAALCFEPVAWTPSTFKMPLQPIIPCLSIFTNIFLISSLGNTAYYGFAGLFGFSLIWYILYGVQRSPEPIPAELTVSYKGANAIDGVSSAFKDLEAGPGDEAKPAETSAAAAPVVA